MRVVFIFSVVALVAVSSYMASQGIQHRVCSKSLVQIVKPNDNSIGKSYVTPDIAERFSTLGWQIVDPEAGIPPIVTEKATEEPAIDVESNNADPMAEESLAEESAEKVKDPTVLVESVKVRTFVVVPEESKASYIVNEEFLDGALERLNILPGPATVIGITQQVEGHLQLNSSDLTDPQALGSNSFTVNIESLTSDDKRRDKRIRKHNLESSIYPLATFTANAIEGAPAEYAQGEEINFQLLGDLVVREITVPVTFDVIATLTEKTIEGKMSTNVQMTDFGFDPPDFAGIRTVENYFTIEVEFKMIEKYGRSSAMLLSAQEYN